MSNSIKEQLNKGVSPKEVSDFVFSTENLKDFVLNVGLQYNIPIEDAPKIICSSDNFKLYDFTNDIDIAIATKLVKADSPLHEVHEHLEAKRAQQLF